MTENINESLRKILLKIFSLEISLTKQNEKYKEYEKQVEGLLVFLNENRDGLYQCYPHLLQEAIKNFEKYLSNLKTSEMVAHSERNERVKTTIKKIIRSIRETVQELNKIVGKLWNIARKAAEGKYQTKFQVKEDLYGLMPSSYISLSTASEDSFSDIPNELYLRSYEQTRKIFDKFFDNMPEPIARYEGLFWDMIDRYFNKVNMVFVCKALEIGIIRPVEVSIDPNKEQVRIEFIPKNKVDPRFKEAAKIARQVAYKFLARDGLAPKYKDFKLTIKFPYKEAFYEDKSASVIIALAIVAEVTGLRLNPRVAVTGELNENGNIGQVGYLKAKLKEADQNPDIQEVIIPNMKIPSYRFKGIGSRIIHVRNFSQAVENYFGKEKWEKFLESNKRIRLPMNEERYIHRGKLINQLTQRLKNASILVVWGLVGTGKTILLGGIRRKLKERLPHQYLIRINKSEKFDLYYKELGRWFYKFGEKSLLEAIEQPGFTSREIAKRFVDILKCGKYLILFDQFDNILDKDNIQDESCKDLIEILAEENLNNSRVIIATNEKFYTELLEKETEKIGGFGDEEARDFLRKCGVGIEEEKEDTMKELINTVEGHPQALKLIVGLKKEWNIPFTEILEKKESYVMEGPKWSYKKILSSIINRLESKEKKALYHFSVYREPVTYKGVTGLKIWKYIHRLIDLFLIDNYNGWFSQHSVVRDYAYFEIKKEPKSFKESHKQAGRYYLPIIQGKIRYGKEKCDYPSLMREALFHYKEAEDNKAVEKVEPYVFDSLKDWGNKYLTGKKYYLAERYYREMINLFGVDCHSQVLSDLAYCLEKQGKEGDRVEMLYRKSADKGNTSACGRLSVFLLNKGKEEEGRKFFNVVVKENYNFGEIYEKFALVEKSKKNLGPAIKILEKGVENAPKWDGNYIALAKIYLEEGNREKAKKVLKEGTDSCGYYTLNKGLAKILREEGNYSVALEEYEEALRKNLDDREITDQYIDLVIEQKNWQRVYEFLRKSGRSAITLFIRYYDILKEKGYPQQASYILDIAFEKYPKDKEFYLKCAEELENKGESGKALKILNNAVNIVSDPAVVYLKMAEIYQNEGDTKKAIEKLKMGIEERPNSEWIYTYLLSLYKDRSDWDKLINLLKEMKNKFPRDNTIYYLLGQTYLERGDKDKAIEFIEEGIKKIPIERGNYLLRAKIFLEEGNKEKAVEILERGINYVPENRGLYIVKARIYEDNGDLEEAIRVLEKSLYIAKSKNQKCPTFIRKYIKEIVEERGIDGMMGLIEKGQGKFPKYLNLFWYLIVLYAKIRNSEKILQILDLNKM